MYVNYSTDLRLLLGHPVHGPYCAVYVTNLNFDNYYLKLPPVTYEFNNPYKLFPL